MSTIFTKIINGEIPSYKIYEDDFAYAFLDINPINRGHTLVVSKIEKDYLFDLDEENYKNLMISAQKVAKIIKEKLGCKRVCVLVEGYEIPHVHIKLIPTNNSEDLDLSKAYKATDEELKAVQKFF